MTVHICIFFKENIFPLPCHMTQCFPLFPCFDHYSISPIFPTIKGPNKEAVTRCSGSSSGGRCAAAPLRWSADHAARCSAWFHGRSALRTVRVLQELERQYSPSRWSHRMSADDVIKAHVKALKEGAFLVSGIYDLQPILSTYVNEPLKMTEEVAVRNSPSKLVPQLKLSSSSCQIVVAVAEHDSPEFRKQSEEYYKALEQSGLSVTMEDVANTDHFNIIEQLVDGEYHLTKLLLKMMGKN
ncbi:kynurenine formamidase-like isoform X4 [Acanthochromis polyacanthus]|uniref:kynurenine formamidase-like isoform X4 n=1 Tax=Acanthochromis polyacanthus TaxID=80966 RepID=UPI002234B31B|nr:kynurenine formamidase-like isoform X4 [Acanthochromis polyacanthus]